MTRVPGQPINTTQIDKDRMPQILSQLAEHVANWRQKIPPQPFCGSLRFHGRDHSLEPAGINLLDPVLETFGLSIRGLVGESLLLDQPIESLEAYYRIRMTKKIEELQTKEDLKRNRVILPLLESFMKNNLSRIEVISTQMETCTPFRPFLFTHYDLSPRNVLVSGNPPRITGIVDFEFAGFFSQYEEFVNDRVNNDGDWSKEDYQIYCQQLEQNGVNTPYHGFDEVSWKHILQLKELVQNIAPWWLPGPHEGIALEQELQKSEELLRDLLGTLSGRTG